MRYLKAIAQGKDCHGHADTVILQFYRHHPGCPDDMIYEVICVDTTADGKVDDLRPEKTDPEALDLDKRHLEVFANSFLTLNWFNAGEHQHRALTMYVDHFGKTGRPNAVKLDFHERSASRRKASLVYKAAAYDGDSDGVLESFTNSDIDRNGVADHADKELIRSLCLAFLAFEWHRR